LAVMLERSFASGAERAYRRALEKLTVLLVESGALYAVRLKKSRTSRNKKTAAVSEYQADCDSKWGGISFGTISRLNTNIRHRTEIQE